ncbi:hypothetical protein KUTeg_000962 [Tegillarca granosa]|uniref:Protein kinase domain-containing protein n=1 Tax=Tegillarca granosa TaxID=220873 RepID=A0ABQ9FXL7_TEGGR|nr:hypothetical protein KUTeg_000962 [Tegillarca granosa]
MYSFIVKNEIKSITQKDGKWNETENFTWNDSNVLGRGATAVVYKARNKTELILEEIAFRYQQDNLGLPFKGNYAHPFAIENPETINRIGVGEDKPFEETNWTTGNFNLREVVHPFAKCQQTTWVLTLKGNRLRPIGQHNNGTICAVKVFHDRISSHGSTVPIREMQILRKLKHPNIISILGIEQEFKTGNQVLIMEYCEGGSLYAMLDQPKYAYGFPEEEFLVVLKHIVAGLQYLRQNDMIHRDIKPGNIIRFINYDGSRVRFAGRVPKRFNKLIGLNGQDPHMFERAVLQKRKDKMFGANVDLWSLGVTIYHLATGQLPFQPYGGRNNARTITNDPMTTEKASGVISGKQKYENGPIEWGRELPSTCLLSSKCSFNGASMEFEAVLKEMHEDYCSIQINSGNFSTVMLSISGLKMSSLKSLITPLVAGLLECNTKRRSTFETVFSVVTDIMERKILKVFSVGHGSNFKIYINGSQSIDSVVYFEKLDV